MRFILVVITSELEEDHGRTIEAEKSDNRHVKLASFVVWP